MKSASNSLEAPITCGERLKFSELNSLDRLMMAFRLRFQDVQGHAESHILRDRQNIDLDVVVDAAFLPRDSQWSIPVRQIGMSN